MFEALFSFSGRMGRIAYICWGILAICVIGLIAGMFLGWGLFSTAQGFGYPTGLIVGIGLLIAIVWASLATTAKRVRDMGFPPALWIIGLLALILADEFILTRYVGARFLWPFNRYTPIGGFISVVSFAMLILWPPAEDVQEPPVNLDRRFNRA